MKFKSLLFIASAATAFAGTPVMTPAPAPAPTMCEWFVGASFGQLDNVGTNLSKSDVYSIVGSTLRPLDGNLEKASVSSLDFNMYTFDVGRTLVNTNGWDIAAYLELGWLDGDMTFRGNGVIDAEGLPTWSGSEKVDVDIVPLTLNFKVEHAIYGPVNAYLTGGAGYAWSKVSGFGSDTRDGGFYGQLSAGLVYKVCPQFDLFAGARWCYLSHVNLGDTGVELNNNKVAWEVGARYNF